MPEAVANSKGSGPIVRSMLWSSSHLFCGLLSTIPHLLGFHCRCFLCPFVDLYTAEKCHFFRSPSIALGALSASRLLFYCSNCMCSVAQGFFGRLLKDFYSQILRMTHAIHESRVARSPLVTIHYEGRGFHLSFCQLVLNIPDIPPDARVQSILCNDCHKEVIEKFVCICNVGMQMMVIDIIDQLTIN